MGSVITAHKGIQDGVSKDKGNFIERYIYWRKCALLSAVVMAMFCACMDIFDTMNVMKNWDKMLDYVPQQIHEPMKNFVMANAASQGFLAFAVVVTAFYLFRAYASSSDLGHSQTMAFMAWSVFFWAPFVLFVCFPFASTFRMDLMQRDICAVSLASVMNLGPELRTAIAATAGNAGEFALINVAQLPSPPMSSDPNALKFWAGYAWCDTNKLDWEARIFSTRWVRMSKMSPGPPSQDDIDRSMNVKNVHVGVVPTALLQMGHGHISGPTMRECGKVTPVPGQALPGQASPGHATGFSLLEESIKDDCFSKAMYGISRRIVGGNVAGFMDSVASTSSNCSTPTLRPQSLDQRHPQGKSTTDPYGHAEKHDASDVPSKTKSLIRRETRTKKGLQAVTLTSEALASFPEHQQIAYEGVTQTNDSHIPNSNSPQHSAVASTSAAMLQLDTPAQNPACVAYMGSLGVLKSSLLARRALVMFLAIFSSLKAWKVTVPQVLAVVQGIDKGADNVKKVFPMSELPGYILGFAVLSFLPGLMVIMAFLSQSVGAVPVSLAISCLLYTVSMLAYKGFKYSQLSERKKFEKFVKWFESHTKKVQFLGALIIVLWVLHLASIYNNDKPGADDIHDALSNFDLRAIFGLNVALTLMEMVARTLMFRFVNILVATDTIIGALMNSSDDKLVAKATKKDGSRGKAEDEDALMKQWHIHFPQKHKKKKKKKKDKDGEKDNEDPEWAHGEEWEAYGEGGKGGSQWQQGKGGQWDQWDYGGKGHDPSAAQSGFFPHTAY